MLSKMRLAVLQLVLLLATFNQLQAEGRTARIVLTGDAVPDGNGLFGTSFTPITLNESGDLVFRNSNISGTTGGNLDDLGLFQVSAGTLAQVLREGQPAPDGNGEFSAFTTDYLLNDNGSTGLLGILRNTLGGTSDNVGIFRGTGATLTQVARKGQNVPNVGTFDSFQSPVIDASDRVAFWARLTGTSGGTANDTVIYRADPGGSLAQIAREGQAVPGGNGLFGELDRTLLQINRGGAVAFRSDLTATSGGITDDTGMYVGSGGALTLREIAREGQLSPDGNGTLRLEFLPAGMNDDGQVLFFSGLSGTSGGVLDDGALFRSDDSGLTIIVHKGQSAPDGDGVFEGVSGFSINRHGTVGFTGTLINNVGSFLEADRLYRGDGTSVIEFAREGQAALDGNGQIESFGSTVINDSGVLAYSVTYRDTAGGFTDNNAILLSDGIETLKVVREGDTLAGSTVNSVSFDTFAVPNGDGFNNAGQLAYSAGLASGEAGIFVFTPELYWRSTISGSWDSAASGNPGGLRNWTLSLRPSEVHDTFIGPDNDVFVTGPAGAETVKSLTIGGGLGIATLNLNGGSITAIDNVRVNGNGVLTGTGEIIGNVINFGEVIADNVTITGGDLINNGLVGGTTAANNRINAQLQNQAGGEVRVGAGESMRITGTNNVNLGRMEIVGGEIEFDQNLNNQLGGTIFVNNGTLRTNGVTGNLINSDIFATNATLHFDGSFSNLGTVGFTLGNSFIFGNVNNTGSIIQSGAGTATFFNNFTNNGTVQVSAGSTAVFFGDVSGSGAYTGTGTVFFEGNVFPGTSPGQVSVEGDLNLGIGAHTLMEIGGLVRGDEYDAFDIGGDLKILGGELEISLFDTGGGLFNPELGDSFDLFSAESISGDFDVLTLAVLGSGLGWQLDFLTDAVGTLDVARLSVVASAVPVPAAVWLFGSGLLGLIGTARRRTTGHLID